MTVVTGADTRAKIQWDDGTGRILTIYQGGGEAPLNPAKAKAAEDFKAVWLPDFVTRLLLFKADRLSLEQSRQLIRDMREQRVAANAFERVARIQGQGWVESFVGAIEGVQAARFGDRRYENKAAEFLSLVDRLFPQVYEVGEEAAYKIIDTPASKK